MKRREFLTTVFAVGATSASFRAWCAAHGADHDFASAAAACGWKPDDPEAFYFLQATDLHMTENPDWDHGALEMKDKFMGRCFIDEINAMNALPVKPAVLFLTGDLTSQVTMNPACWGRAEKKWAHYRKYITDRLQVPWHQFIGNNDCAAVPYQKVYTDRPLYWHLEKGGICFVGLHGYNRWKPENTNHAGILYDDEQLAWLRDIIANTKARTLAVLTHEGLMDGDSHCARRQLAPILDLFHGDEVWNIYGHGHCNVVGTIRLGRWDVRTMETMTPVGIGFTVGDGGYRVFYCREGKIVGSALRWLTPNAEPIGYAPDARTRDQPRVKLIEETWPEGTLATALVGSDPFDITGSELVEDRIADYYIRRPNKKTGKFGRLVWSVPRAIKGKNVAKVLIRSGAIEGHVGVSADGKDWSYTPVSWTKSSPPREIAIPAEYTGDRVWLSLSNESCFECKFYGYALLAEERGHSTFPKSRMAPFPHRR